MAKRGFFFDGSAKHRSGKSGTYKGTPTINTGSGSRNNYNVFSDGRANASRNMASGGPHPPVAPGFPGKKGVAVQKPMSRVGALNAIPKPNTKQGGGIAGAKFRGARFNSGEY